MDTGTRIELADSVPKLKKVSEEAEVVLEQKMAPRGRSLEDSGTAHEILGGSGKEN